LAHQALKDKGRKANDISPLEAFYLNLSQRVLPGSQSRKLPRPGIEAFYSNNLDSEDFIALVHKDLLAVAQGVDVSDVVDVCLDEYLSVGNRREDVERYISVQAAKQLWMTFAKLDTFGRLGLPNAEINELLIRVATLSNIDGFLENMSSIASLELMGFSDFLDMLTKKVFQLLHKKLSITMVQNLYDGIVHELLKKGTLKKKGHIVRNWKDRFFVLTASSLSYYEGQDMSVMKGQITISTSAAVCLISEQGRPVKSSNRFRVTCGSSGTATECIASDTDSARDWVQSIELAILYHRIEGRNFLHRLCQARKFAQRNPSDPPEDTVLSPVTSGEKQLAISGQPGSLNSTKPTSSENPARPIHSYEDVELVDKIIESHKQQQKPQKSMPGSKSTAHITTGRGEEYAVIQSTKVKKNSAGEGKPPPLPSHGNTSTDTPPEVPKHRNLEHGLPPPAVPVAEKPRPPPPYTKKETEGLTYIDIDFVQTVANPEPVQTSDPGRASRRENAVEYTSIDEVATKLAVLNEGKSCQSEFPAPPSAKRSPSPLRHSVKPMKDVSRASPRGTGQDGDYINLHSVPSPTQPHPPSSMQRNITGKELKYMNIDTPPMSPTAAKPMKEVSGRQLKKAPSKDGDYIGMGYTEGKLTVRSMQEVPSKPKMRPSTDGEYVGVSYVEGQPKVKNKPMVDVTRSLSPRKQQPHDDGYIGLLYDSEGHPHVQTGSPTAPVESKDGYINIQYAPPTADNPKAPPPPAPHRDAEQVKHQSSLTTPPKPAPRRGSRPKSSIEGGDGFGQPQVLPAQNRVAKTDDYIRIVPDSHSTKKSHSSGGTTGGLSLVSSSKDSTHDYLLVVPESSASNGKKTPPGKPAPYGETHTYINQQFTSSESPSTPPPSPPKSRTS
jgi:hypothetical protein